MEVPSTRKLLHDIAFGLIFGLAALGAFHLMGLYSDSPILGIAAVMAVAPLMILLKRPHGTAVDTASVRPGIPRR